MNIFILHEDPVKAAQDQCDKHVELSLQNRSDFVCSTKPAKPQ